jgi:hypothetical protein
MQVSGVTATSPAHPRSHIPIHPADATPEVKVNVKDTVDWKVRAQTYAGSWPLDSMAAELQVTVDQFEVSVHATTPLSIQQMYDGTRHRGGLRYTL